MKIATWNVNSIRQREKHLHRWLERARPDLVVLQEIKCEAHSFPALALQGLGYKSEVVGQKSYNGVAVLSRLPFAVTHRALPGLPDGDRQARYLEVRVDGITIVGIYLPNGNSRGDDGFAYKLTWMDCLADRAATLLEADTPLVMTGDFNVAPADEDVAAGALSANDALVRPETRARFRRLLWLGLTDGLRALHPGEKIYTFWDYQAAAWPRDSGLRIDHVLLSPTLVDRLGAAAVHRNERGEDQPSDHVPVLVELE
jgi:exodeoxyribonuclease III